MFQTWLAIQSEEVGWDFSLLCVRVILDECFRVCQVTPVEKLHLRLHQIKSKDRVEDRVEWAAERQRFALFLMEYSTKGNSLVLIDISCYNSCPDLEVLVFFVFPK